MDINTQNSEVMEIDIRRLLYLVLDKIWIIIICILICGAAACAYTKLVMPDVYTASVSLYVKNGIKTNESSSLELNDINASQKLVETSIVILSDEVILNLLGEKLMENYDAKELSQYFTLSYDKIGRPYIKGKNIKNYITLSKVNDTEVLKISATTSNPQLSVDLCNYMGEIAPDVLVRVMSAGSVEKIGDAIYPETKSGPNTTKNTVFGMLLGAVLGFGIILLLEFLNRTIKNADDISKRYNLPVLGEIPAYKELMELNTNDFK